MPQPGGIARIESVGGITAAEVGRTLCGLFCFVAILEIATAYTFQQRRCGQQYGRCCALFKRFTTLDRSFQAPGVLLKSGRNGAGIERV